MSEALNERVALIQLDPLTHKELTGISRSISRKSDELTSVDLAGGNPQLLEGYINGSGQVRLFFKNLQSNLSPSERIVLDVASILDPLTDIETLKILCIGIEEPFGTVLNSLIDKRIFERVGDQLRFSFPEFPKFIESRLSLNMRKKLHAQVFFAKQLGSEESRETYAQHAYFADLFAEAFDLYIELMRKCRRDGHFSKATTCYERALGSAKQLNIQMRPEDELDAAQCYSLIGKNLVGKDICQRLLTDENVYRNKELVSKVYTALAVGESNGSERQVEYFRNAISVISDDAAVAPSRYAQLAQALDLQGRLHEAQETIQKALSNGDSCRGTKFVMALAVRGALEVHRAEFKSALKTLQSLRCSNVAMRAGVLSHIALCLEHLGNIGKATIAQQEALRLARISGYTIAEIIALANLGAFAVKVGALPVAEQHFQTIGRLIRSSYRNFLFRIEHILVAHVETSTFLLEKGLYSEALAQFSTAMRCFHRASSERDRIALVFLGADIQLRLGRKSSAWEILNRLPETETIRTPFFQIERTLLDSRLDKATELDLENAIDISVRIGTVHQECRLLLAVAELYVARDRVRAVDTIRRARILAKKHSYRLLFAKATLQLGSTVSDARERVARFSETLSMAEDMMTPELIAEASYRLAICQWESGEYFQAQRLLARSTTSIKRLTQGLPQKYSSSYLADTWKGKALATLEDWTRQIDTSIVRNRSLGLTKEKNNRHIRDFYEILTSDGPMESFLAGLVKQLERRLHRTTFVLSRKIGCAALQYSGRSRLSDNLSSKLSDLINSVPQPTFGGKLRAYASVAWIPIKTDELDGGIYVESRNPQDSLTEEEIEYLTVVGGVTNSALTRILSKPPEPTRIEKIPEFHGIVGKSATIREVCRHIEIAAGNLATVLIEGESGTGKELVARAIHQCSGRAKGPFIPVDCGAIPETLIESELFGSRKGSFTGAIADRAGVFEAADGGTLFLDEISNTSPGLQARLLRVIQEKEVRRIGETRGRKVDVRLIVATNTNLDVLVQHRQFRQDLLFRLKVLHIKVPPLRHRRDDIPLLVETFVRKLNAIHRAKKHATNNLIEQLSSFELPGNVRELQNQVERAYAFAKGAAITSVPEDSHTTSARPTHGDEVQSWFKDITEGRKDFWSAVYDRYKRRDISREKVLALVDLGLRSTRGNYKTLASMLRVKEKEYRRFMDFLRRNDCELDFRPYRKAAAAAATPST